MASGSHVARRVSGQVDRDFPALPTLPASGPCEGLAFVQRAETALPPLRALRDDIAEIRRGGIDPAGAGLELVLVMFVHPVRLEARDWPGGLRLAASNATTLCSFVRDHGHHAPVARAGARSPFRRLDLWWNGRLHRIAVETLAPVPVAALWEMPPVSIHPATPRPVLHPGRRTGASAVPLTKQAPERTRVSHARIPLSAEGPDLFGQMTAELNAQMERTRLSSIFRQMRDRLRGGGQEEERTGEPGILQNLAGWIRWHTPLGASLRRQYGERMNLVEKLIASGKLDDALKLALRLAASDPGGKQGRQFPNALPGARATLDFDTRRSANAAPVLGEGGFQAMRWRYRQLAEQLERDGDFRRAAYIHSQLLDDHLRAVQVLEKGEMYQEAAKLALGAKLAPVIAIRMLYLAGEQDAALALARRTECFEQLAEDSRTRDEAFHAYVVKAWTDMLVATGQPLRALQVTDFLAQSRQADVALFAARRGWLAQAVGDVGSDALNGELTARALLTVYWASPERGLHGIEDFPFMPMSAGEGPFSAVFPRLQAWVRGEDEHAADALLDLLAALVRLAGPDQVEQAGFWRGPAQPVIEALARAVVGVASSRLGQTDLHALQSLLRMGSLPVMATDIQKLRKLHSAPPAPVREWRVPAAAAVRPAVRTACLLGDGGMLIWRDNRILELLDRHGAPRWRQSVSDVTGLVAIGTSPHVIIVQAQRDGSSLLTRFSAPDRSFHPIGAIDLAAHHDVTSESQWLVQIGGEIGALDLVKLCAREPAIEFLWSCALTDRLRAIAFAHLSTGPSWLTRDMSGGRFGVIELWTLQPTGTLATSICRDVPAAMGALQAVSHWYWDAGGRIASITQPRRWMGIAPWDEAEEERARMDARRRDDDQPLETFQPCDFGRPFAGPAAVPAGPDALPAGGTVVSGTEGQPAALTLLHAPDVSLTCLARGIPAAHRNHRGKTDTTPAVVLIGDADGQLFIVNPGDRRVTPV